MVNELMEATNEMSQSKGTKKNRWMTRSEQEQADLLNEVRQQYHHLLNSLNVRVDLTLKQRRDSDLLTVRPRMDDVTVNVPARRIPLRDAPLFAPFYYLNEDESQRIAVRVMNRLNKLFFGNRARRTQNPERLTALICQHDKDTRRHLHCLIGVPPTVSLETFSKILDRSLANEPFVHRHRKVQYLENLAASIHYNANDQKSRTDDPILYLYPRLQQERQ
jgi:hypothetical protein